MHEELLVRITLKLRLVVQSLGPGLLDNGGAALSSRLWAELLVLTVQYKER